VVDFGILGVSESIISRFWGRDNLFFFVCKACFFFTGFSRAPVFFQEFLKKIVFFFFHSLVVRICLTKSFFLDRALVYPLETSATHRSKERSRNREKG